MDIFHSQAANRFFEQLWTISAVSNTSREQITPKPLAVRVQANKIMKMIERLLY
jgi:hypothetical protein